MQHQPPPYPPPPPPAVRQAYPYAGHPYYAAQYGGQYMDRYPPYQYQVRPPPDYHRYADQPYGPVHPGSQPPMQYQPIQTQHLPPKLKAAARPMVAQPVYQVVQQPAPVAVPMRVMQSEVVRVGPRQPQPQSQIQSDWGLGTRDAMDAIPPPGFDIIGRGGLPTIHFDIESN